MYIRVLSLVSRYIWVVSCAIVGIFRSNSLFIGGNCRSAVNEGRADFTPIFLSEVPLLFRRKILNLDVALIQVSPPDNHGFCTLGPSVDTTRAAIQNAKFIIGEFIWVGRGGATSA